MNKTPTSFKQLLLPGFFAACLLFFSACSSTRLNKNVTHVENWARFQVTFKKNTSIEEKQKALSALEKHIVNNFFDLNPTLLVTRFHVDLKQVNNNVDSYLFSAGFDVGGDASTNGVVAVIPHRGPKRILQEISPVITDITPLSAAGQPMQDF